MQILFRWGWHWVKPVNIPVQMSWIHPCHSLSLSKNLAVQKGNCQGHYWRLSHHLQLESFSLWTLQRQIRRQHPQPQNKRRMGESFWDFETAKQLYDPGIVSIWGKRCHWSTTINLAEKSSCCQFRPWVKILCQTWTRDRQWHKSQRHFSK